MKVVAITSDVENNLSEHSIDQGEAYIPYIAWKAIYCSSINCCLELHTLQAAACRLKEGVMQDYCPVG